MIIYRVLSITLSSRSLWDLRITFRSCLIWYLLLIVLSLTLDVLLFFFFHFVVLVIALHGFRADDEPVDPKKYLEEACKPKCVKPLLEYQVCSSILDFLVYNTACLYWFSNVFLWGVNVFLLFAFVLVLYDRTYSPLYTCFG